MSDRHIYNQGKSVWISDEPTPFIYPIEGNLEVRRITFHKNERAVLFMDYTVKNNTRYVLYFEVTEFFRGKRWYDYVTEVPLKELKEQHPNVPFLQPNVVFLRISPWLARDMPKVLAKLEEIEIRENGIMDSIYFEGSYNDAVE